MKKLLTLFRQGAISEEDLLTQIEASAPAKVREDEDSGERKRFELASVLDRYRAAEASGAETLSEWSRLSLDAGLSGGLRTIAAREAYHADLLARRVRELGAEPDAQIPSWLSDYNSRMVNPAATDVERLEAIVGQFPDIEAALAPLEKTIESIDGDPLTRELLRTIEQDERASLEWFHSAYALRATRT
ncbi:MAG: ferritin-like domain-containing protein [Myxococcales bacterium]|nr:MAG: ferritin-like domain-containing protein [Myxococcales bacterium]